MASQVLQGRGRQVVGRGMNIAKGGIVVRYVCTYAGGTKPTMKPAEESFSPKTIEPEPCCNLSNKKLK